MYSIIKRELRFFLNKFYTGFFTLKSLCYSLGPGGPAERSQWGVRNEDKDRLAMADFFYCSPEIAKRIGLFCGFFTEINRLGMKISHPHRTRGCNPLSRSKSLVSSKTLCLIQTLNSQNPSDRWPAWRMS